MSRNSNGQFRPISARILVKGTLNDTPVVIEGTATVPCLGLYEADLTFSTIPPNFHPGAISTYIVSICCFAYASMRNGGLSISAMGGKGYTTRRILKFGEDEIIIEGDVSLEDTGVLFRGSISGTANLPENLTGNSIYMKKMEPVRNGEIKGIGQGSLFMSDGNEIQVRMETRHQIRPTDLPNPCIILNSA